MSSTKPLTHWDVFISYASQDTQTAQSLRTLLKDRGVRCWMAPEEVPPGEDYAKAILEAIEAAPTFVLLLSRAADASIHVRNEVERASSKRRRIIPVRLEQVPPGKSLELHLARCQWLDAWDRPLQSVADSLAKELVPSRSQDEAITALPKGLRSYGGEDAGFFLDLLPGKRRAGLPESVHFWKTQIEAPDDCFSVGLIYGPSGCGKSSLVRAGLLPQLGKQVRWADVVATPDRTEASLLKELRSRFPEVPQDRGLVETLAHLGGGESPAVGAKVVIVIDQFEQWLLARHERSGPELLAALRHCHPRRVQALLIVREDFFAAAERLFDELDVPLQRLKNSARVDPFKPGHAREVLTRFGRALGRLPEAPAERDAFLNRGVQLLTHRGQISPVQLSLLVQMIEDERWDLATLKGLGGAEGLGITFLERTLGTALEHRRYQKAARAVLGTLLPASGDSTQGQMKSDEDLLTASGYQGRPKEFARLRQILDEELRLITRTGPGGQQLDHGTPATVSAGRPHYQLTHDFLVEPLRAWLTRKEREGWRGRARLVGRWCRRNPALAGLSAALLLALVVGTAGVTWQWRRAQANYELADQQRSRAVQRYRMAGDAIAHLLVGAGVGRQWLETHIGEPERKLLGDALRFYQDFLQEAGDDPESRLQTANALRRIGDIHQLLAEHGDSDHAYRDALKLLNDLVAEFPAEAAYRLELAHCHNNLGMLLKAQKEHRNAKEALGQALELRRELTADFRDVADYQKDLADSHNNLGDLLKAAEEHESAEGSYRQALQLLTGLVDRSPNPEYREQLVESLYNLALLFQASDREEKAEQALHALGEAAKVMSNLVADSPRVPEYREGLVRLRRERGVLLQRVGRLPEAEASYREALAQAVALREAYPELVDYQILLDDSRVELHGLANSYQDKGQRLAAGPRHNSKEAEEAYRAAARLLRELAAKAPAERRYREDEVNVFIGLGELMRAAGRPEEAEKGYRQAVAATEALVAKSPNAPWYQARLGQCHAFLRSLPASHWEQGHRFSDRREWREAAKAYAEAIPYLERLADDFPTFPDYRHDLAIICGRLAVSLEGDRKSNLARDPYRKAAAHMVKLAADFPRQAEYGYQSAMALSSLARFLQRINEHREAGRVYHDAVIALQNLTAAFPQVPRFQTALAEAHEHLREFILICLHRGQGLRVNKPNEAEGIYREALTLAEKFAAEFSDQPDYRMGLAHALRVLGAFVENRGRLREAEDAFRQSLRALEALTNSSPRNSRYQSEMGTTLHSLAMLLAHQNRADEVGPLWVKAIHSQKAFRGGQRNDDSDPDPPIGFSRLEMFQRDWAALLLRQGEHQRVAKLVAELSEALPDGTPGYAAVVDLAQCVTLAEKDEKLAVSERKKLAEAYGTRAVELLGRAAEREFQGVEPAGLKQEAALAPLRPRDDFKKLFDDLEAKAKAGGKPLIPFTPELFGNDRIRTRPEKGGVHGTREDYRKAKWMTVGYRPGELDKAVAAADQVGLEVVRVSKRDMLLQCRWSAEKDLVNAFDRLPQLPGIESVRPSPVFAILPFPEPEEG